MICMKSGIRIVVDLDQHREMTWFDDCYQCILMIYYTILLTGKIKGGTNDGMVKNIGGLGKQFTVWQVAVEGETVW